MKTYPIFHVSLWEPTRNPATTKDIAAALAPATLAGHKDVLKYCRSPIMYLDPSMYDVLLITPCLVHGHWGPFISDRIQFRHRSQHPTLAVPRKSASSIELGKKSFELAVV
jgi:hypothetical protein